MTIRHVEPLGKIRTKIVVTVGPASCDPGVLREMVEAGADALIATPHELAQTVAVLAAP